MEESSLLGKGQRRKGGLCRWLCCCLPKEEERTRTRGTSLASPRVFTPPPQEPKWKALDFASGRMYLIGQGPHRAFARFRHVDLGNESFSGSIIDTEDLQKPAEVTSQQWRNRYEFFSRFDDGMKIAPEDWEHAVPERIAKHMAKRCRGRKVLDAACGAGECAIQFAKVAKVVALNEDAAAIERTAQNAAKYDVQTRIELKHGSFQELGPLTAADTVFVRTTAMQSSLADILQAAGSFAQVMLYLAKSVDPDLLAVLVAQQTELDLTCEFDLFQMSGELKGICCYLGDLAVLSREEMLRVMCHRLRVKTEEAALLGRYFNAIKLRSLMRVLDETETEKATMSLGTRYLERLAEDEECRLDELISPRRLPSLSPAVLLRVREQGYPQAEVLPMILAYCFLPFHVLKVQIEETGLELDGMPVLETNGKKLHSTSAIGRYLCQLNGLHPSDKLEVYHMERTAGYLQTIGREMYDSEANGSLDDFYTRRVPGVLAFLSEKVAKRLGVGGPKPTLADFMLVELLWKCRHCPVPESLQSYQHSLCTDVLAKYQLDPTVVHGLFNP